MSKLCKILIFLLVLFIVLIGLYLYIKYANLASDSSGNVYPPITIYKTKGDYYDKVPVYLSLDKTKVIGYPDVNQMGTTYPDRLHKGYLLSDGVMEHTGFLNITFEEYTNLGNTPYPTELFAMVADDSPFIEMYYCGNFKPIIWELNIIIDLGLLGSLCDKVELSLENSIELSMQELKQLAVLAAYPEWKTMVHGIDDIDEVISEIKETSDDSYIIHVLDINLECLHDPDYPNLGFWIKISKDGRSIEIIKTKRCPWG